MAIIIRIIMLQNAIYYFTSYSAKAKLRLTS